MPIQIAAFPTIQSSVQTVTLGTKRVGIGMVYNESTAGWYMDLFAADGSALFQGRRLSPSFSPSFGLAFESPAFDGGLTTEGQDGYTQAALGSNLLLWWYSPAELAALAATAAALDPDPTITVEVTT